MPFVFVWLSWDSNLNLCHILTIISRLRQGFLPKGFAAGTIPSLPSGRMKGRMTEHVQKKNAKDIEQGRPRLGKDRADSAQVGDARM